VDVRTIRTALSEVILFEPNVHEDKRGFFMETYREDMFQAQGISTHFVQENLSRSKCNVLRGLHYQLKHPQAKLCWVPHGAVLDVAVDIRYGSPTFGQYVAAHLTSHNLRGLYVPRGFAHGVLILKDNTFFQYKCDDYYSPEDCKGIAWNDPYLKIEWELENPILSDGDQNLPCLKDIPENDLPTYSI
jgi:dTDP-4-dehydrorhamnose 3,5-epimerase